MESLESRCLLSGNIVAYPSSPAPDPSAIIDAGGKLWFTDESPSDSNVWMLNPNSPGIPAAITGALSRPVGITADSNGNVWVTEPGSGRIGMINTSDSTPTVQNFPQNSPLPSGAEPDGITAGLDQAGQPVIWFTDFTNNKIESYDPSTGSFSTPITPPGQGGFTVESEIVAGTDADHTLWFPEQNSTTGQFAIGGYDPRTTQPFQVLLPKAANGLWETPYGITAGPGGNIWVGEAVLTPGAVFFSSIWKISPPVSPAITPTSSEIQITNPATGAPVTPPPLPYGITVAPDGNIWFTDNEEGAIYSFNPTTEEFATEAVTTSATPILQGITTDSNGNIWFADNTGSIDVKYVATQLEVTSPPPATVTAGNGFSVSVTAEDSSGNVDPTYNGSVTLDAVPNNPGGSTVTLTATAIQGVATFPPLTLDNVGGYSLTATANGLTATPSSSVNVVAALASQLVVAQPPPAPVTAGNGFAVIVNAENTFDNVDPTYNGSVTLHVVPNNPGSSPVTLTATAIQGVATFPPLTLDNAGGDSLTATANGLTATPSSSFNVVAAAASQLWVTQQPPTTPVTAGNGFPVAVAFKDEFGNAATFSGNVNVALSSSPSIILQTVTVNGGSTAQFSGLILNNAGNYSLLFTASGLTSATSSSFTVSVAPPAPQIQSATKVPFQKTNKKNKPIGKPVLIGYQFIFNMAMSSSITNMNDYQVQIFVPATGKGKRLKPAHYQSIGFSLANISSTTEQVLTGTKTSTLFKNGGRIILNGISSAAGGLLGNNVVGSISKGGGSITLS